MKFDIKLKEFTSEELYTSIIGDYADNIKVQYFSQSHEYIFSSTNKRDFKLAKFDSDMNIIINNNSQLEYDFTLSDDVYGMDYYNIIIIPDDKVYIFIIDSNYKGNTTTRFYSVPEIFSPEIIYPISLLNSIPTNIPTIIPTNMPTTIQNTIPTTFPTTFPTNIPITSTIPITIPITIHTTFTTTIPTTIPTTFPNTIPTTILNKNIYISIPSIILTTILPDSISNQKFSSTIVSSIYYKIETSQ